MMSCFYDTDFGKGNYKNLARQAVWKMEEFFSQENMKALCVCMWGRGGLQRSLRHAEMYMFIRTGHTHVAGR